ncbi:uncharacterized protein LOC130051159 [Ostrea edulis]|uniref:uncharacterized protein LOC130051159 n=1 Tax=Ostrea edulis TaxID=37623 RepID=UPI0024AEF2A0|nr:uncharacterized protein LOC130051159 [Ostrea edulis]
MELQVLLTVGIGVLFLVPAQCFVNLARTEKFRGTPSQSTTYTSPAIHGQPDHAVDGLLELDDGGASTCSFTLGGVDHQTAWWKMTMKVFVNVAYLQIHFRKFTNNRQLGFSVYAFNDTGFEPPYTGRGLRVYAHDATCLPMIYNVTLNTVTKGIALYNSRINELLTNCFGYEPSFATLETCEILIMGCAERHYGENCTPCDSKCLDRQCDAFDGSCIYGCHNSLMIAPGCNVCKGLLYGENCTEPCGHCFNGSQCDMTGVCLKGCEHQWGGPLCDVCSGGFYGPNCTLQCGQCKNGSYCNVTTGICEEGCQDNWRGDKCDGSPDALH